MHLPWYDAPAYATRMNEATATSTLRALRRVLRAAEIGNRKLAAATGLTPSQLLVLRDIDSRQPVTPGSLARALDFSQATITAIVDRLEARGLVQRRRSDRDRRRFHLTILDAGRAMLKSAPDPLQTVFTSRFAALLPWEQAMLLAAAERLSTLMGAEGIDAAPLLDSGRIDRSAPAEAGIDG